MKHTRKFEWMPFINGDTGETIIAFDMDKYSEAESLKIAAVELDVPAADIEIRGDKYHCYYGFGINSYDEVESGYYLTEAFSKNGFRVWTCAVKKG